MNALGISELEGFFNTNGKAFQKGIVSGLGRVCLAKSKEDIDEDIGSEWSRLDSSELPAYMLKAITGSGILWRLASTDEPPDGILIMLIGEKYERTDI